MSDALSQLLMVAGVRGSLVSRAQMAPPYGIEASATRALFHAPLRGEAVIGIGDQALPMKPGDVAVLPRGSVHVIRDQAGRSCQNIRSYPRHEGRLPTVHNHGPVELDLLCGTFELGEPAEGWLLSGLPDLFIVRGSEATTGFVRATLELMERDLADGGPGATLVADRLVEVLVVVILRGWMESATAPPVGWLRAMRDPRFGPLLSALHTQPAADWTLETMSRRAGMSRTRFTAGFREAVGEAPKTWLTTWRIAVARRALRNGADVALAAEEAGYASEASFARAFKRVVGVSPGAWRRTPRSRVEIEERAAR